MATNFRHQARQAIARAKAILEGDSVAPEHLRYAALDVRMAMEALTYERAHSYRKELPESAYETWQPRKLMQVLLDIDPNADRDSSLRIGREQTYGVPATEMQDLGHETVLNMGKLKKHYDALGSYLHMPTLKQLQADGDMSLGKLRTRLDKIIAYVDAVLSSPIFTINFGTFSTAPCIRCEKEIRWRIPRDKDRLDAVCRECDAPYELIVTEDRQVRWEPKQHPIKCAHPECGEISFLWEDQFEIGSIWICGACVGHNQIVRMNRPINEDGTPWQPDPSPPPPERT